MSNLVCQVRKINENPAKIMEDPEKKKKKKDAPEVIEVEAHESKAALALASLEALAKKAAAVGSKMFFVCAKCRWSRGGSFTMNATQRSS